MKIKGLAHRGYPIKHPENTLRGFRAAAALGFTHIELDVHLTKDGVPVVIHDATVDRTTNGSGAVKDFTFNELLKLDAGEGEFVPTLEEVLLLVKDRMIVEIELKQEGNYYLGLEEAVLDVIERVEMKYDVFITSFDHYSIAKVRELDRHIELGLNIYGATPALFPYMAELDVTYLAVNYNYITPQFVDEAKKQHIQLIAWTPDKEEDLLYLRAAFPDVLLRTNNLEGLANVYKLELY